MNKRPLSVIIIACVYIATGVIGVVYHLTEFKTQHPFQYDVVLIELVSLAAIIAGVFMLRGHNWARWLENLIPINIEDEMRRSYLDYAMSVIIGRALPDVRDGLKPVHRRILYGCRRWGCTQPAHRKCAKIVGEVLGKIPSARRRARLRRLGPHGAGFLAALSADRRPGQLRLRRRRSAGGHAVHRSAAVAHRAALLEDIDKETVDFKPNYDDSEVSRKFCPRAFRTC
jgi:hypothetical protein